MLSLPDPSLFYPQTVWNATSKTLTTTAHAVGATTTASILTFMIKNDYAQAVNTAPVHVAGT